MQGDEVVVISLPQLFCLLGMLAALCTAARRVPRFAPFRDAALGLVIYVVPSAFLWLRLLCGYEEQVTYGGGVELWPFLVAFPAYFGIGLTLSAFAFRRGDYRWYREPVVLLVIQTILWLIIFPVFGQTHCR
jgi:hypothetical protein